MHTVPPTNVIIFNEQNWIIQTQTHAWLMEKMKKEKSLNDANIADVVAAAAVIEYRRFLHCVWVDCLNTSHQLKQFDFTLHIKRHTKKNISCFFFIFIIIVIIFVVRICALQSVDCVCVSPLLFFTLSSISSRILIRYVFASLFFICLYSIKSINARAVEISYVYVWMCVSFDNSLCRFFFPLLFLFAYKCYDNADQLNQNVAQCCQTIKSKP